MPFQEVLETVKDIKACNQKDRYMSNLQKTMDYGEKVMIRSELATGVCVTSAQAFLKIGIATTVLTGVSLLAAGKVDLLVFLVFLIVVSRVYDPLNICLMNMAAAFSAKVRIERMRQIEEQKVQLGTEEYDPQGYDIVFDHVSFAYNKNEGVLSDVSFCAKQGQVTALVGPSGGGKSTAAKLAARFWDVEKGKLLWEAWMCPRLSRKRC